MHRFWIRIAVLIFAAEGKCATSTPKRIAVIGEGVIGVSSALALIERDPRLNITVFFDTPFETTVSYGPAGLYRVDKIEDRPYAKRAFARYAKLFRELPASETGVNLVSGHILSTNLTALVEQDEIYGDIVYNFHYLREDEMQQFAPQEDEGHVFAIHYTAYTTEGGKYVPWMKRQLLAKGVRFIQRRISNLNELYNDFDVIVNCAGLNGGKLAGDGDDRNMFPIRGIIFEVNATWHHHFLFKDFTTFSIPTTDKVFIGSVKQPGRSDLEITQLDRDDILGRYYKLQPTFKNAAILSEWSGLRPGRYGGIRLEMTTVRFPVPRTRSLRNSGERVVQIVHNYGHGGHGFSVSWGCAEVVADLVIGNSTSRRH
uniref:D-aspartate oxidase 1 n=1 Tax=Ascaris suum TaxID=6253 RepID=F1L8U9_ASCSU